MIPNGPGITRGLRLARRGWPRCRCRPRSGVASGDEAGASRDEAVTPAERRRDAAGDARITSAGERCLHQFQEVLLANHQAIGAVAAAVVRLLEQSWHQGLLIGINPEFAVYHGKDFSAPMATGISVFVYQVGLDTVVRTLPPAEPDHKPPLPVRAYLLLTAWAKEASTEHALLGWAMRAIADHPLLPSGFLNAAAAGVFRPEEAVELSPIELTNDEVFRLWQVLPSSLQLSVPYVARVMRIESEIADAGGGLVIERDLDAGVLQS
jgi:hypothetical protein